MSRRSGRSRLYTEASLAQEEESSLKDNIAPSDEEQEVTRCVCGLDELDPQSVNPQLEETLSQKYQITIDHGLFIQCEMCLVWQHGYCVGLFMNQDVPEKYWCELCKPDAHAFVFDSPNVLRSLYKPVNDKRKKVSWQDLAGDQRLAPFPKPSRPRGGKRNTSSSPSITSQDKAESRKDSPKLNPRKDRRHNQDSYDEQLKMALQLSANESITLSNLPIEQDQSSIDLKVEKTDDSSIFVAADTLDRDSDKSKDQDETANASEIEGDESNLDNFNDMKNAAVCTRPESSKRSIRGSSNTKSKRPRLNPVSRPKVQDSPKLLYNQDELVNQSSKPRYVSEHLTMFELGKRTGAILEWLGQRQLEFEEDRDSRVLSIDAVRDSLNSNVKSQCDSMEKVYNENIRSMAALTERVIAWEQKYGKYVV